ncbi:hypothetical protein NL676_033488 [Syzygium grande]|nr:hypothetical protein NL676_033488 [Syzygium grande]
MALIGAGKATRPRRRPNLWQRQGQAAAMTRSLGLPEIWARSRGGHGEAARPRLDLGEAEQPRHGCRSASPWLPLDLAVAQICGEEQRHRRERKCCGSPSQSPTDPSSIKVRSTGSLTPTLESYSVRPPFGVGRRRVLRRSSGFRFGSRRGVGFESPFVVLSCSGFRL